MKYLAIVSAEDPASYESFTASRETDLETPKEVLKFICDELKIAEDEVCNILLLKNGAESPEIVHSWVCEDWDEEEVVSFDDDAVDDLLDQLHGKASDTD